MKEAAKLQSGIEIAKDTIDKYDKRIETLKDKIESDKLVMKKMKQQLEVEKSWCSNVGLDLRCIEQDHDCNNKQVTIPTGKYEIGFSNIDPHDRSRRFIVTVSISSDIKIDGTQPKDLFTFDEVEQFEQKVNSRPDSIRFFIFSAREFITSKLNQFNDK